MPRFVEIGLVVLEKTIFLNFVNVFSLCSYYLPLKKVGPFIWTNLSPDHHQRMHYAKFRLNWPSGSGEDFFLNFVNVFSLYSNYLPLRKGGALHLNKLEFSTPKDALCQVSLKLAQWFWRRRFFNFVNVLSLFLNYLPWKRARPFILTNLNPIHPTHVKVHLTQLVIHFIALLSFSCNEDSTL